MAFPEACWFQASPQTQCMLPSDTVTATQPTPQSYPELPTQAQGMSLPLFYGRHQKELQATCGQQIPLFIWVGEDARGKPVDPLKASRVDRLQVPRPRLGADRLTKPSFSFPR